MIDNMKEIRMKYNFPLLLHGRVAQEKLTLKILQDGEGHKNAPKINKNNYVTGKSQTKNMSPRINTNDSIDLIIKLEFYCNNRGCHMT